MQPQPMVNPGYETLAVYHSVLSQNLGLALTPFLQYLLPSLELKLLQKQRAKSETPCSLPSSVRTWNKIQTNLSITLLNIVKNVPKQI